MTNIIKIDFNENHEPVVSARAVHEKLGINQRFTDWFNYQQERLGLEEGADFLTILGESTGGRPSTDYRLTLDVAKHICMVSGGDLAKAIRQYFIQVEKAWNSPEQVMARALQMAHQTIISLTDEAQILLPKAEMHDLFLSATNAQPMGDVAKALGVGRNNLFKGLRNAGVLMDSNTPYQRYIDRGYFKVIEKPIVIGDKTVNKPLTLVTAKGIDYIARIFQLSKEANHEISAHS